MEIHIPQISIGGGDGQSEAQSYTVQPGDTLGSIAERFGIELDKLISANFVDLKARNNSSYDRGSAHASRVLARTLDAFTKHPPVPLALQGNRQPDPRGGAHDGSRREIPFGVDRGSNA